MAHTQLRSSLIALALLPAACGESQDNKARSSITVELPPARPATPVPGFTLDAPGRSVQPGHEQVSQAVRELAVTTG
jgi:hypothetical protein